MSPNFPDLLIAFDEAVEALKVKLSQDASKSTTYNGEFIQSIAKDIADNWAPLQAMVQGRITFATKAEMDADLAHIENTLAEVWNDPDTENNGLYGKVGDSGTGSWQPSPVGTDLVVSESSVKPSASRAVFNALLGIGSTYYEGNDDHPNQGFISPEGQYLSHSLYLSSDYLPIMPNTEYELLGTIAGTASSAWYDEDEVFISSFQTPTDTPTLVTSPANAKYLRTSWYVGSGVTPGRIRTTDNSYQINKLVELLSEHNATQKAENVYRGSDRIDTLLAGYEARHEVMQTQINYLNDEIDEITDGSAPFFVVATNYVIGNKGPEVSDDDVAVLSRDSDSAFTVAIGDAGNIRGAVVVRDSTNMTHHCYSVESSDPETGQVTIRAGVLPTNIDSAGSLHQSGNGQHLSRFGYKGYAEYITRELQKYSYKKDKTTFEYHPPLCNTPIYSDSNIYNADNSEKLVDVTRIGGAATGGYVAGTTNLIRKCQTLTGDENAAYYDYAKYLSRGYDVVQTGAGAGIEFAIPVNGTTGFLELFVSGFELTYTSSSDGLEYVTANKPHLVITDDNGQTLLDATYELSQLHRIYVEYKDAQTLTLKFMLTDNAPGYIRLGAVYTQIKREKTSKQEYFSDGDHIAFLGDSWTQFPAAEVGETLPTRPDGSGQAEGMQFLSEHMRTHLASRGISVTTVNWGRGGQTSAWGKYWVNQVINSTPKPTHCVVCFYINDNNSLDYHENSLDSNYDFDPDNMWLQKNQSEGGVKGSLDSDMWLDNMEDICEALANAGIKPIVMMPSNTASSSQSASIQSNFLNKMAVGFRYNNDDLG